MGLLERYKGTSSPAPSIAPSVAAAYRAPYAGRPSGTPPGLSLYLCSSHCHPAARQCKKKAHFLGRFCGVRNASLRRTFCCGVHHKRCFKAHLVASTTLLVGSFQLAADSRLSTHSSSTLDLGSLWTLETRDPATASVDSEASSSTVALGKAFSMAATARLIVCGPHASSRLVLRSGTRNPHQSPSSTRALSQGHPPRSCKPPSSTGWLLADDRNSFQWTGRGSWRWKVTYTQIALSKPPPR